MSKVSSNFLYVSAFTAMKYFTRTDPARSLGVATLISPLTLSCKNTNTRAHELDRDHNLQTLNTIDGTLDDQLFDYKQNGLTRKIIL